MPENRRETRPLPSWAGEAASIIALVSATLYFVGWSYNLGFYGFFGIDPEMFKPELTEMFTTAFRVSIIAVTAVPFWLFALLLVFIPFAPQVMGSLLRSEPSTKTARLVMLRIFLLLMLPAILLLHVFEKTSTLGRSVAKDLIAGRTSLLSGPHPLVCLRYTTSTVPESSRMLIRASSDYIALWDGHRVSLVPRDQVASILFVNAAKCES